VALQYSHEKGFKTEKVTVVQDVSALICASICDVSTATKAHCTYISW